METGETVHYADSTRNARSWLWEFGNGDISHERSGEYVFKKPGRYQVRLQVDGGLERKQIITVHRSRDDYGSDELVRMKAPATAFQGEIVSFKGYGPSKEWRWQFGESGIVDSREQNPLYAYTEPGIYEVLLTTENTQYPVRHTIEILPQYTENDSTDVLVIIGNDIREHLQAIVDGKPFNTHYNYILKKYLCGNPDIAVTVNNSKKNDFYSYCQRTENHSTQENPYRRGVRRYGRQPEQRMCDAADGNTARTLFRTKKQMRHEKELHIDTHKRRMDLRVHHLYGILRTGTPFYADKECTP
ncbi:PKD domain-containing protein [Bacteroides caccae]|nr:PKD domain-containing protein [Bacteroides caccae]